MPKELTMDDVAAFDDECSYIVINAGPIPVVELVTQDYNKARGVCVREENNVMLVLTPETIEAIRSGEYLEIQI